MNLSLAELFVYISSDIAFRSRWRENCRGVGESVHRLSEWTWLLSNYYHVSRTILVCMLEDFFLPFLQVQQVVCLAAITNIYLNVQLTRAKSEGLLHQIVDIPLVMVALLLRGQHLQIATRERKKESGREEERENFYLRPHISSTGCAVHFPVSPILLIVGANRRCKLCP